MARQSFQFGKRQREIAKKQKKEQKRLKKAERLAGGPGVETPEPGVVEETFGEEAVETTEEAAELPATAP